jgi:hypothetical protein
VAYEPTGQAKVFIDAVRREPARIWTPEEAAILLGCTQSRVGAWLDYAMRQKAVFRGKKGGKVVYSGQPFPPEAAYPAPAQRNTQAAGEDIRVPKFTDFVPPSMTAPRPGSEVSRAPAPKPPELCRGCSKAVCWEKGCQNGQKTRATCAGCTRPICQEKGCVAGTAQSLIVATPRPTPAPTPAPTAATAPPKPAPAAADASIPEAAGADPQPEGEEDDGPDAFISCRTGQIVLVGLEPDEEGRVTIPADLVNLIKRHIAWSPAR